MSEEVESNVIEARERDGLLKSRTRVIRMSGEELKLEHGCRGFA